ncbi:MAG TPA: hypothetical protein VM492_07930, partial [Sumerlaeia bacterium]|nr:hypothetical protein [Sumerlaeia bacterium]
MQPGSNGIRIPPVLSRALWLSAIVAGVAWYGWFRLLEPLRHEPFRSAQLRGNDFKHIYLGSWMLTRGQDPYDAEALLRLAHGRGLGSVNPYVY